MASAAGVPPTADPVPTVPTQTRMLYGLGSIAYGIKDNGFSVFLLLFYNQIVGLDAALVGLMLLIALVLDAFIDPVVGHLSDRTRTRWGRRHPWIYASIIPLFIAWMLLWSPPETSQSMQLLWLLVCATLVRMTLSLNEVPSLALAPEMTPDYHERTAIVGWRYMFGWLGGLIILAAAYGVFRLADPDFATRASFYAYALTGAIVMALSIGISAVGTHRRYARPMAAEAHQPSFGEMLACARFRPFLLLLMAALFGFANQGVSFALSSYMLAYVWKFDAGTQVLYAGCLFIGVLLALVMAPRWGRRYGKRGAGVRFAIGANAFGVLPYCLLLAGLWPTPGSLASTALYLPIVTLAVSLGIGVMITAASMMADVSTAHQAISGRQQEGTFYAGWFFTQKCVTGVGIFLSGQVLALIAFPARANPATIDPQVVLDLAGAFVIITILLGVATAWALSLYPLDRGDHQA